MAETKSATRVTKARSSELRLSWAPVSTSCSRMLPSRSRSNSATVSVRRILLVSCISVTAAIEKSRQVSVAAVTEMEEPSKILRTDTVALFERLREGNILLQEVLAAGAGDIH